LTLSRLAIVLIAVSALAVAAAIFSNALDHWAPNIAVEAIAIALTVAVIDRIIREREAARRKPRLDRAMRDVGSEFQMLVRLIALDYVRTHEETARAMPEESLQLLDQWLEDQGTEDVERDLSTGGVPFLVNAALQAAESLRRHPLDVHAGAVR
jgi:hypothetical protein